MQLKFRLAIYALTISCLLPPGQVHAQQNGLNFDGVNDYASLPVATSFTAFTFECWVKFTGTTTANQDVLVYTNVQGPVSICSQQIFTDANGHFKHFTWDGGYRFVTGTTVAALNTWYHVAISGANNGLLHLYVNGIEEGNPATCGTLDAGDRVHVGNAAYYGTYLNGTVDEIRIWTRQLCAAEISASMNGELLNPASQSGLHRYYKLNQGTASGTNTGVTTITDLSANGVNGTLYNSGLSGSSSNWVSGAAAISGTLSASYNAVNGISPSSTNTTVSVSGNMDAANCGMITSLVPSGGSPLSGSVITKVTVDGSVQSYNGQAYVQRHYDIEPASNATTATATITLYYTQADFDAFNAARGSLPSLPTSSSDVSNAANLRISQFHGVPTGGSVPGNYPSTWAGAGPAHVLITPSQVSYNSTYGRWEVTFPVTGFSGFFASTAATPLPVSITSFSAELYHDADVLIQWTTAKTMTGGSFAIERSTDGVTFNTIGVAGSSLAGAYTFHDYAPLAGKNYYRLRSTDVSGTTDYTDVRSVQVESNTDVIVSPNPAGDYVRITSTANNGEAVLTDIRGQEKLHVNITPGTTSIDIHQLPAGFYLLRLNGGKTLRLVKQ